MNTEQSTQQHPAERKKKSKLYNMSIEHREALTTDPQTFKYDSAGTHMFIWLNERGSENNAVYRYYKYIRVTEIKKWC